MANLQKVVKLTQVQYNTLASGGTVGDYTGLDDNYIYLIEDNNEYIATTGGEIINNGRLDFFDDNDALKFSLDDYLAGEIIYLADDDFGYMPLFADSNGDIIYSDTSDYHDNTGINTETLRIGNSLEYNNYIDINSYSGTITYHDDQAQGTGTFVYTLPAASGELALDGNVVHKTGSENIAGTKVFTDANTYVKALKVYTYTSQQTGDPTEPIGTISVGTNGEFKFAGTSGGSATITAGTSGAEITVNSISQSNGISFKDKTVNSSGTATIAANYIFPTTDKGATTAATYTIATTEEIPQVKRYI